MSWLRSASRGRWIVTTFSRWYRSLRNVPAAIGSSRLRFVAERIRTLTLIGSFEPTRVISPLSSTRSSLICVAMRHVAHFVEKQRAAVGVLELADAVGRGVGERPADVAEQLALQDVLAQARRSSSATNGLFLRGLF